MDTTVVNWNGRKFDKINICDSCGDSHVSTVNFDTLGDNFKVCRNCLDVGIIKLNRAILESKKEKTKRIDAARATQGIWKNLPDEFFKED